MKYKVIFLEGLSEDELKALDALLAPGYEGNPKNLFHRTFGNQQNKIVYVHCMNNKLTLGDADAIKPYLRDYPDKYVKVIPQFEVKIEAKLKLPFPEEIEENGQRYRLVQE